MTSKTVGDGNEEALFQAAMRDVAPLPDTNKAIDRNPKISPYPRKERHPQPTPENDALSDHIAVELEAGDNWCYARPGISQQTVRRLYRGHWPIEWDLDLHGCTRNEARRRLNAFLDDCTQRKLRCVRVIHGKGLSSKNQEPVLKTSIGNWLMQRADVLAFRQAKPEHGGGGAILLLLKAAQ